MNLKEKIIVNEQKITESRVRSKMLEEYIKMLEFRIVKYSANTKVSYYVGDLN